MLLLLLLLVLLLLLPREKWERVGAKRAEGFQGWTLL